MKNEMKRLTGACVRLNGEKEKKVKEKTLKKDTFFFKLPPFPKSEKFKTKSVLIVEKINILILEIIYF